jgi:hypothetical protein
MPGGFGILNPTLAEDDIVGIGHSTFRLKNGELRQYVDEGEITIAAGELMVKCWHCAGPTRVSSTQWPS